MSYLLIGEHGDVEVKKEELSQEDMGLIDQGSLMAFCTEIIRGEPRFRKAVVSLNEAEGDAEEDEYEVDWELLS